MATRSSDSLDSSIQAAAAPENLWAHLSVSKRAKRTINPIRNLVQSIDVKPNPALPKISLSVGDPCEYGNLKVPDDLVQELVHVVQENANNGYTLSMGALKARTAVAAYYQEMYTRKNPDRAMDGVDRFQPDDIFLASGASGALELIFGALVDEGDTVLLPRPGFPLFQTLLENLGAKCEYYELLPDQKWEVDTTSLTSMIDKIKQDRSTQLKAVVCNNPSNPCGSVYSREAIRGVVGICNRYKIPIVSDEIYADMVFRGEHFTSFLDVTEDDEDVDVPVFIVSGISKRYVAPGWRLGWVVVWDPKDSLKLSGIRDGLRQLTTRMLLPNALIQAVLPKMLASSSEAGVAVLMDTLEKNAKILVEAIQRIPGLDCVSPPQGSMYLMVRVDCEKLQLKDDMEFTKLLYSEKSVMVLPGQCFQMKNFVRLVFCAPPEILNEACDRMEEFCKNRIIQH